MDELAQKDFTYRPSTEEFERYKKNWYISLNTSGRHAPMKLRSDFREALTKMHRLHRESGEERPAQIHPCQHQRWHSSSSSSSTSCDKEMNTGGVHKLKIVNDAMSKLKEEGDLFWTLTHQDTQSVFFLCTTDSNLLQPTECVNRTPSHVTFSRVSQHTFQCRT